MIHSTNSAGLSPSPGAAALAKDPISLAKSPTQKLQSIQAAKKSADPKLREAFDSFVGETFYGQMLSSMRKMTGKAAYFDGGRAEEIFRDQLDQVLSTEMTKASASGFTGPMYDLFMLNRK